MVRRLALIGLMALCLGGAIPAAQSSPPPLPTAPPSSPGRPSARFSLLFLQYRRGAADAAIDTLSAWKEADVLAEALPSPEDDVWTRAALVTFLTETGTRRGTFGRITSPPPQYVLLTGWGLDKAFEAYSYRSYLLVKDLTRIAKSRHDERLLAFCGRWYSIVTSFCVRYGRPARVGLQAMADHDLNDRAEIRLLIGSINEGMAGPFVPTVRIPCTVHMVTGPDGCVYRTDDLTNPTREALWGLKGALEIDPSLVEAHLRLGHLLHMLNLNRDARPHLERALADATSRHLAYLAYMAALFLGEVDEHEDRLTEAIAYFRQAVAADPTAHIANVALGEALLRSGDTRGWSEARRMFDGEDETHPRAIDPWFYYRAAQYWSAAADLQDLRELVRGGS